MMQNKRAAAQQPRQQREAQAGKRRRHQRREDIRVLRRAALRAGPRARRRAVRNDCARPAPVPVSPTSNVTAATCAAALFWRSRSGGGSGVSASGANKSSNGTTPSGRFSPNAQTITDGKHLGGDLHRESAVVERADAAAGDQRLGADARERGRPLGAPPKQRQRRRDHAGAPDAEHGQNILDDIRQLDADDGVGRQPHAAQPPGDRGNHAIGLGIGEAARLAVGEARAVRRIDQRQRIGTAPREVTEHVSIDRFTSPDSRRCRIAEDHCSARFGSRHHVSGR